MASITSLPSGVSGSSLVLLATETASSSATVDFTSDIDSTYKEYIFKFIDIHPATNGAELQFQTDTGTNTSYNQTIQSTTYYDEHKEDGSGGNLAYSTGNDQALGTAFQILNANVGSDNDQSCAGYLHLFDPASTTFVKHFLAKTRSSQSGDYAAGDYVAGYFNITTAITRVRFKMSSGNMDAGTIKMYGVV